MRIGEVLKLTPSDIEDRKLTLRAPKSGKELKNARSIAVIETSPKRVSASPIRSSLTPTSVDILPKHALHERLQGSQWFFNTSDGPKKEIRLQ